MALHHFVTFMLCLISYYEIVGATDELQYECVRIYDQPAFQHPLLENHKIQSKPSFSLDGLSTDAPSAFEQSELDIRGGGCPDGMVPIEKRSQFNNTNDFHTMTSDYPGQHFATLDTRAGNTYQGALAHISLQKLQVEINQYSKSQIWLEGGPPNDLNSMQFGVAVHPRIYGDSQPRFTILWTLDSYRKTGCYNARCPGFVQVDHAIYPGQAYTDTCVYNGSQFVTDFFVYRDRMSGNWVLLTKNRTFVGYWPGELFAHMKNGASLVRFGGNTFPSTAGISPPMGNGHYPSSDLKRSAYFTNVKVARNNVETIDIDSKFMKTYADINICYRLDYLLFLGEDVRQVFTFGGPGGRCGL